MMSFHAPKLPTGQVPQSLSRLAGAHLDYMCRSQRSQRPYKIDFDASLPMNLDLSALPNDLDIQSLSLTTLECPESVVSNNRAHSERIVSWINGADVANGQHVPYTATCAIGSYDMTGMINELLRVMNLTPKQDGTLHEWFVILPTTPSNAVSFYNVLFINLGHDPISTVAESATITVEAMDHGLTVGDFVTFKGVQNNPGAISNAVFNGASYTVASVVDKDHFTLLLGSFAYTTSGPTDEQPTGYGGGDGVQLGKGSYFAFLPSPPRNALELIGFPKQSGANVALSYGLNATVFARSAHSVPIPDRLKTRVTAGQVIAIEGITALGLPDTYVVNESKTSLKPRGSVPSKSARLSALREMSEQSQSRIYFTDATFALARVQTNRFDSGTLHQSINLAGDAYCYLYELDLQQKLAKIQLRSGNGFMDFNTFSNLELTERELRALKRKKSLHCTLVSASGAVLFYQGLRLSGSFQVAFAAPLKPLRLL